MEILKNIWKGLYIHPRFYYCGVAIVAIMVASFFVPILFVPAQLLFYILIIFLVFDIILLFWMVRGLELQRLTPEKMSNGDQNQIDISIKNNYAFGVSTEIIDEIPAAFQIRDFFMQKSINSGQELQLNYTLRPTFRGLVSFGKTHVYAASPIRFVKRKFTYDNDTKVPVYPSFIQMKKYELLAFSNKLFQHGLKKVRRLGHTMEFEKIKEYVAGDDIRTVNWKATAKTNKLMVNQYQDERSQSVYCIVDKGRIMKMPFNGLSLLDYAINACLVVTNVVLRKQDYAGFFSFSKKVDNRVAPDRKATQMQRIVEALYNVNTDFFESDYGRLYADIKQNVSQRSLLLLFTNFETLDGLHRQLPYLKAIAKNHLLIVIFFQNTELEILTENPAQNTQEVFDKVIAEKFTYEKRLIVQELRHYGIHCILTKPENLTIDTLNKYLEIKARGMI